MMVSPLRVAARRLWTLRREQGADAFAAVWRQLDRAHRERLKGEWRLLARTAQLRPDDCKDIWVLCWGRGAGKTHTGSEHTLDVMEDWGAVFEGALVSKTITDVRKTMIHGPSGLIRCAKRRGYDLRYVVGDKMVYHPNGAILHVMSAEQKDVGRGPNLNFFWADEIAAWGHDALELFKVFMMGWRSPSPLGRNEQRAIITTTPKPNAITRYLLRDDKMAERVTITTQHTLDNDRINPERLVGLFGGTRLGEQELAGALLDDANLLTPETIDKHRIIVPPEFREIVIGLDPSIDVKDTSDACGIVAMGATLDALPHGVVLEDATIQGATWATWARRTVELALHLRDVHRCTSRIVAEVNQGGHGILEALEGAMQDIGETVPVGCVWHKESKRARAQPVCAKAEQGRIHFLNHLPHLEKELCTWVEGAKSPNAMDAFVMAGASIIFGDRDTEGFSAHHGY